MLAIHLVGAEAVKLMQALPRDVVTAIHLYDLPARVRGQTSRYFRLGSGCRRWSGSASDSRWFFILIVSKFSVSARLLLGDWLFFLLFLFCDLSLCRWFFRGFFWSSSR